MAENQGKPKKYLVAIDALNGVTYIGKTSMHPGMANDRGIGRYLADCIAVETVQLLPRGSYQKHVKNFYAGVKIFYAGKEKTAANETSIHPQNIVAIHTLDDAVE